VDKRYQGEIMAEDGREEKMSRGITLVKKFISKASINMRKLIADKA